MRIIYIVNGMRCLQALLIKANNMLLLLRITPLHLLQASYWAWSVGCPRSRRLLLTLRSDYSGLFSKHRNRDLENSRAQENPTHFQNCFRFSKRKCIHRHCWLFESAAEACIDHIWRYPSGVTNPWGQKCFLHLIALRYF